MDKSSGKLTFFYTAAGRRDEPSVTFEQRIFGATADLTSGDWAFSGWGNHRELFAADGTNYLPAMDRVAQPGFLTAFRDPYFFGEGAGGPSLVFTASSAATAGRFNGAIGLARLRNGVWHLDHALVTANGVNTELERPHIVRHAGLYYLFWSTQAHTFAPGLAGVTGLYGMASKALEGPYEPLNGNGLVVENPLEQPYQAYAWHVLHDLTVISFVDIAPVGGELLFVGTIAPTLRIELSGLDARVISGWSEC